jgi:hypothetical protein
MSFLVLFDRMPRKASETASGRFVIGLRTSGWAGGWMLKRDCSQRLIRKLADGSGVAIAVSFVYFVRDKVVRQTSPSKEQHRGSRTWSSLRHGKSWEGGAINFCLTPIKTIPDERFQSHGNAVAEERPRQDGDDGRIIQSSTDRDDQITNSIKQEELGE